MPDYVYHILTWHTHPNGEQSPTSANTEYIGTEVVNISAIECSLILTGHSFISKKQKRNDSRVYVRKTAVKNNKPRDYCILITQRPQSMLAKHAE